MNLKKVDGVYRWCKLGYSVRIEQESSGQFDVYVDGFEKEYFHTLPDIQSAVVYATERIKEDIDFEIDSLYALKFELQGM